jgi:hypothetical protein
VVELDGVLAHSADNRHRDARRDNANALDGYLTLRYSWVPVAYHACDTAIEVYRVLRRNGLSAPIRPCGPACPVASSAPRVRPRYAVKPSALPHRTG